MSDTPIPETDLTKEELARKAAERMEALRQKLSETNKSNNSYGAKKRTRN